METKRMSLIVALLVLANVSRGDNIVFSADEGETSAITFTKSSSQLLAPLSWSVTKTVGDSWLSYTIDKTSSSTYEYFIVRVSANTSSDPRRGCYKVVTSGGGLAWNVTNMVYVTQAGTSGTITTSVSLDKRGGSGGTPSVTATYHQPMPDIETPSKTGYSFAGYFTSTGGDGTKYYTNEGKSARDWNLPYDQTKTLYAYYIAGKYTVDLNACGGSGGTAQVEMTYNSTCPTVVPPARGGYSFTGYYSQQNGQGVRYYRPDGHGERAWTSTTMSELYACWTGNVYHVELDMAEGDWGSSSVDATFGSPLPDIIPPSRAGWTFAGYYDGANGTGIRYYDESGKSARDWDKLAGGTLHAKWVLDAGTPNLSFYKPDTWPSAVYLASSSGDTTPVTNFVAGETAYLNVSYANDGDADAGAHTMTVYLFDDDENLLESKPWNVTSCSSGDVMSLSGFPMDTTNLGGAYILAVFLDSGETVAESDEDDNVGWIGFEVVPALPPPTTYAVTYKPGTYGTGSQQTATKTNNVDLVMNGATFTRTGYTQTGWATSDGGAMEYYLGDTYTANAPATLYPFWAANTYTVSYELYGGQTATANPSSATYDSPFRVSAPTRSGHTFTGWTVTSGLDTSTAQWGISSVPSAPVSPATLCVHGESGDVWFLNLTPTANGSVTLCANWEDVPDPDAGWTYTIENGCATVTGHSQPTGDLVIPEMLGGCPVVAIGNQAFNNCKNIISATIPNTVTNIGGNAFIGCEGLTQVSIPNGVTTIGADAFRSCTNLTSISIPASVTSIYTGAFHDCSGLTAVHISDLMAWCGISFEYLYDYNWETWAIIGYEANTNPLFSARHLFLNGIEIKKLIIPKGVTSIGSLAFHGCFGLTSATIPHSVTNVGYHAFLGCDNLSTLYLPRRFEGNTSGMGIPSGCNVIFTSSLAEEGPVLLTGTGMSVSWLDDSPAHGWSIIADENAEDGYILRSDEVNAGETATVSATVEGPGLLDFDWRISANRGDYARLYVDDVQVAQITRNTAWATASIAIEGDGTHALQWTYEHRASVAANENAAFLDNVGWHPVPTLTLAEALDGAGLVWTTDAGAEWAAQTTVTADGADAAVSGPVADGVSGIETTVSGPGTLAWRWKLDAADVSGLDVILDDDFDNPARAYETSGDWAEDSLTFAGDGTHTIRFEFWNFGMSPSDCAYLDMVSWVPVGGAQDSTVSTPEPVPHAWLSESAASILAAHSGDYEAAALATAANGRPVWECYVAGLDPTDATDDFIATIEMVNGQPQISVGGRGERPGRVYTVEGKADLGDSWGPTNAMSRFFHIKVEVE